MKYTSFTYFKFFKIILRILFGNFTNTICSFLSLYQVFITSKFNLKILKKTGSVFNNFKNGTITFKEIKELILYLLYQILLISFCFIYKRYYLNMTNLYTELKIFSGNIYMPYYESNLLPMFKVSHRIHRHSHAIRKAIEALVFDLSSYIITIFLILKYFKAIFDTSIYIYIILTLIGILLMQFILFQYYNIYKTKSVLIKEEFISDINDISKNFMLVKLSNENDEKRIIKTYIGRFNYLYAIIQKISVEIVGIFLYLLNIILLSELNNKITINYTYLFKYSQLTRSAKNIANFLFEFQSKNMELNNMINIYDSLKKMNMLKIRNEICFNKNNIYVGNTIILNNIDLKLRIGDVFCLIGNNGSGKSVFIKFMMGLYYHDNEVTVDNNKIKLYESDIVKSISYCPPIPYYFEGDIFTNIKDEGDKFEDVINTTKKYKVHDFLLKLTNGYQTKLDESTSKEVLQIVNLMRALHKKCRILLLDEVFTYNKSLNIKSILDVIIKNEENKLIFVVLHDKELQKLFHNKLIFKNKNIKVKYE